MKKKQPEYGASHSYRGHILKIRLTNDVWHLSGNHPETGKRFTGTLKTKNLKVAKQAVDEYIDSENGKIERGHCTITFKQLTDTYLSERKRRLSPATLERITSSATMFQRWLDIEYPHTQTISSLTPSKIRKFQEYREDIDSVKPRTIVNDIKNLHSVCKWGIREPIIESSPFDYSNNGPIDLPKKDKAKLSTYTRGERDLLIKLAKDSGDILIHDLIVVLSDTGLRFDEAAHITATSVSWDAQVPTLKMEAVGGWTPKVHDQIRTIPLTDQAQEVMKRRQAMKRNSRYLFETSYGNPIKRNHTLTRLKKLFPDAGIRLAFKNKEDEEAYIDKGGDPARRLHWHSFRNYFIKQCFKCGIVPAQVMSWVGHDEEKMVWHYAAAADGTEAGFDEFAKLNR